ncbi:MAG: DNA methyltransferase [Sphingobium sp.]
MNAPTPHIELVKVKDLIPYKANARTHSKKQISKLIRSMEESGFTQPILIDEGNIIIAGHGRQLAAEQLGLKLVPCIRFSNLSEDQKRSYRISDNQIALESGWDLDLLAEELSGLLDEGWDMSLTGFDQADIDKILIDFEDRNLNANSPDDSIPPVEPAGDAVTQPGDYWLLGNHALLCGNARSSEDVKKLMNGERADMAFTDAPYNTRIQGHVSGNGQVQHREFVEASGEMTEAEYEAFLRETHDNLAASCRDGAIAFSCIDWRHLSSLLAIGGMVFTELKNICVWNKTNAGMGTFYRSQHELVTVWKVGTAKHTNNFGLGEKGRHRSNVWTYAGVNSFRAGRMEELESHPTVKPVAMVADAIRDVSHRGQIILDIFGGSGTTLIAAEKTGRKARLLELDPLYCDVIIRRWEKQTGKQARFKATGRTFEEEAITRAAIGGEVLS